VAVVTLRQPTLAECQLVREWRNDPAVLPMLRTGYKTEAEQAAFYRDVVCNPEADHRYYALEHDGQFIGLGGLTYLSRVHGEAEISLILAPRVRRHRYGKTAVDALLAEAFGPLGLRAVVGECYAEGPIGFWQSVASERVTSHGMDATGTYRWRWE
jgi:RimJ/RimL family protein N-acetyltransferase